MKVCTFCGRRWEGSHSCGGVWQREVVNPGSKRPPAPPPPPPGRGVGDG